MKILTNGCVLIFMSMICSILVSCEEREPYYIGNTSSEESEENLQYFTWGDDVSVDLDVASGWGLTVMDDNVALTNISTQTQYIIAWHGDLSTGSKTNPTLSATGSDIVELDDLSVALSSNYYTITFTRSLQGGTIAFSR